MYIGRVVYQAMVHGKDARKQKVALSMSSKVTRTHPARAAEMYETRIGILHCCEMNLHYGANATGAKFYRKQPICCSFSQTSVTRIFNLLPHPIIALILPSLFLLNPQIYIYNVPQVNEVPDSRSWPHSQERLKKRKMRSDGNYSRERKSWAQPGFYTFFLADGKPQL